MIADDRNGIGVKLCSLLIVKGLRRPPEGDTALLVEIIVLQAAHAQVDTNEAADDPMDTVQMLLDQLIPSVHIRTP